MNSDINCQNTFVERSYLAIQWLKRSFEQNKGGSSAYYKKYPLLKGKWSDVYPETTGYIIETLIQYDPIFPEENLLTLALNNADWLLSIQLNSGAFPGGLGLKGKESIFNTGQIIFGLLAAYNHNQKQSYLNAIRKAVKWLLESMETDGSWKNGSYIEGFIPTYYTRVLWAISKSNQLLADQTIKRSIENAMAYYLSKSRPNDSFQDWSFDSTQIAFTHTIAYTLRGILEVARIMNNLEWEEIVVRSCEKIIIEVQKYEKLAGTYKPDWKGDYSFQCLTGNAQIALLFCRLNQIDNNLEIAKSIFQPVLNYQYLGNDINRKGGIPGSAPIWKKYQIFRYPNWAVKFFLDAFLEIRRLHHSDEE